MITVAVGLLADRLIGSTPTQSAAPATTHTEPAPVSTDMTGFDAAHIIDDDVFYDSTTMTAREVAAFIERVNKGCQDGLDGTHCLAEATFDTQDRETTTACPGGYSGAVAESAAQIISKVATACDVNPQVLLVLIQKEQGLLTASGESLTAGDYEAAAGYACPDGAQCDSEYAGFFHQIYGAAMQFQMYRLNPETYDVIAGVPLQLAYSSDSACGSAEITVANQATAGLYDYTPYQPNAAAYTGGDDCTSWGNWNFYGYFRSFFGDPAPSDAGAAGAVATDSPGAADTPGAAGASGAPGAADSPDSPDSPDTAGTSGAADAPDVATPDAADAADAAETADG